MLFRILSLALGIFLFFTILTFGKYQFPGMDGGVLINSSYQMYLGYIPYKDVIIGIPPTFFLLEKLAFLLFGIHWMSLVIITGITSVITFLLHVFILQKLNFTKFVTILFPLAVQCVLFITISFLWYNRITVIFALLYSASAVFFYLQPKKIIVTVFYEVTFICLMLSKINIALPLVIFTTIALLISSERKKLIILSLLSLFLSITILKVSLGTSLPDLLWNYHAASTNRLSYESIKAHVIGNDSWEAVQSFQLSIPFLLAFLLIIVSSILIPVIPSFNQLPMYGIAFSALVTGLIGIITNNDYNISDGMLIIWALCLLFHLWKSRVIQKLPHLYTFVSILIFFGLCEFIVYGTYVGFKRYNVRSSGEGNFYQNQPLMPITTIPLFKGLYSTTHFQKTLNDISDVIFYTHFKPNSSNPIFFGPSVDFGYAMFQLYPPRGLPLWWEAFSAGNSQNKESQIMIRRFLDANIKVAIFQKNDYVFIPLPILSYLNAEFTMYNTPNLSVYVARNEISLRDLTDYLSENKSF